MWRVGLGRATAFEKVRVARQLRVRPVLAEALASGRVSYCAVRAMSRAEGATVEVDEALVAVAEASTVGDVEAVVRAYRLYQSQERRPESGVVRRGLRVRRLGEGMVRLEAVLTEVEAAELEAVLGALIRRAGRDGDGGDGGRDGDGGDGGDSEWESSCEDPDDGSGAGPAPAAPCEEPAAGAGRRSSREDSVTGAEGPVSWPEQRADALMDLVRSGIGAHAHGADRHLVHVVVRDDHAGVLGGPPISPGELARILCDCSHVVHSADTDGVPLSLGRRRRLWSIHQRRAVTVRDHGRCRWPGCGRTHVDIHHLLAWEDGGRTDIDNGLTACPRHHTMLHEGYFTTGSVTSELTFYQPNGRPIGTSAVPSPHIPG